MSVKNVERKKKKERTSKNNNKKNWLNRFFGQQLNTTSKDYIRKLDWNNVCNNTLQGLNGGGGVVVNMDNNKLTWRTHAASGIQLTERVK